MSGFSHQMPDGGGVGGKDLRVADVVDAEAREGQPHGSLRGQALRYLYAALLQFDPKRASRIRHSNECGSASAVVQTM